jgi:hypothetical protein
MYDDIWVKRTLVLPVLIKTAQKRKAAISASGSQTIRKETHLLTHRISVADFDRSPLRLRADSTPSYFDILYTEDVASLLAKKAERH